MSRSASAKWSALFLVIALPCLTSCTTFYSDRWKARVLSCRQVPAPAIPEAPREFLACPAWAAQVLGETRAMIRQDRIEWECIEDL